MCRGSADMLNNLLWWVILISCWAVLNSNLALLRWAKTAFDEYIWTAIFTNWPETLRNNCNPLIALMIPICSLKALVVKGIIQVNYSRKIIRISRQITHHVDISMTHQKNTAHQLKKGTLTLCLSLNEYHCCLRNDWPFRTKCERNHSLLT